ncbi:MAG TPA: ATP-binding cassette domain-containing protein [Verrucomicrobiota bacterium]|nr:ATP-binding cassette domain-containing protein [Verrucomicrobiota bacterium]HNU49933.1 ATP-binding cassette domain-containing protein [Verrucomicrobiota bacterium]
MSPSILPSPALDIQGVSHGFGAKPVLHDVTLRLHRGQFLSLVGPSGCGKSTLLRAIVGTHPPRQGAIRTFPMNRGSEGVAVLGPGRDRGIVYQQYSLFPFLTARQNVAIGLMLDETGIPFRFFRWPRWRRLRRQHLRQAEEMLVSVRLGDALDLYPHEMSGGMRQRVALAQAMILRPEIILLDEPFGALDEATRQDLQEMLVDLYQKNRHAQESGGMPSLTLIIVTHELNEAIYVGDRVVGLSQYWNWRADGHSACPGATVVYDKPAPVFDLRTQREFERFAAQRNEIRHVVFEPSSQYPRHQHVTYDQESGAPANA